MPACAQKLWRNKYRSHKEKIKSCGIYSPFDGMQSRFVQVHRVCRLLHNLSRPQQAASCRASRKAGTGPEGHGQGSAISSTSQEVHSNPDRAHGQGSLVARSAHEQGLLQPSTSDSDGEDGAGAAVVHYEDLSVLQIVSARTRWLALFCCGLIGTAFGAFSGQGHQCCTLLTITNKNFPPFAGAPQLTIQCRGSSMIRLSHVP
eukprot:531104-Pelagomonas_calceolata.AAC.3